MANTKQKITAKLKRYALNFSEDEQRIREDKQQRNAALQRLLKTSKERKA